MRDRIGLQQILVPRRGDFSEAEIGLRSGQIGARLLQLLIDFRSVNLSEQLSGLDARADIRAPALEVAVRPRIDRRVDVRLHVAGENDLLLGAPGFGWITATVGIASSCVSWES